MSGSDFIWWLEEIWLDLTNPGTADLPSLVFRLIVLLLVIFGGTFLLRVAVTVLGGLLRSYVVPPLAFGWQMLTAPVRLPFRLVWRIVRRVRQARRQREWEHAERVRKEQAEAERLAAGVRERERIAELQKVLKVD